MVIHHARHPVKSKSIELILLYIKPEVTQQEPGDLMRAIIKEPAVPEFMSALGTFVKVEMVGAIKLV
jgi:hypothetical protein